jgi:hypothetical protein
MPGCKNNTYTRISFRGRGVYVDPEIQQDVVDALNIFKEKISPRDSVMVFKALGEFMKTQDFEKLKQVYEGINTFNMLEKRFSIAPKIGNMYKLHPELVLKKPKKKMYFSL